MTTFNESLTSFERTVILHILKEEAPDLISHVDLLRAKAREHTGVGQYTDFRYSSEPTLSEPCERTLGVGMFAEVSNCESTVGFILNVEECRISALEIYVNGLYDFPVNVNEYRFLS